MILRNYQLVWEGDWARVFLEYMCNDSIVPCVYVPFVICALSPHICYKLQSPTNLYLQQFCSPQNQIFLPHLRVSSLLLLFEPIPAISTDIYRKKIIIATLGKICRSDCGASLTNLKKKHTMELGTMKQGGCEKDPGHDFRFDTQVSRGR